MSGSDGAARRLAASLVVAGFHGTALPAYAAEWLRAGLAGVVLFRRNVAAAEQVAALVAEVRRAAPAALVCVDQEGGRVQRLRAAEGFTDWPAARQVGAHGAAAAGAAAEAMGRELRAVGIDVSFAPVLDVDTNPANPVIGDRAYGPDASQVAALGCAVAAGLARAGVLACGKHFPGHGDTDVDSHLALPVIRHSLERLRRVELPPFAAAAAADVPAIMTAHVAVDALEPGVPATMSAVALRLLREELGFGGCVVSDDLEMKAIADPAAGAVAAVRAGVDLLLVCSLPTAVDAAIDALAAAATAEASMRARMEQAAARVAALRARVSPAEPLAAVALKTALRSPATTALAARLGGAPGDAGAIDPTERA